MCFQAQSFPQLCDVMTVFGRLSSQLHCIYIPDQQRHPNARALFISSFYVTRILLGNCGTPISLKRTSERSSFNRRDVSYVFFVATEGRPTLYFVLPVCRNRIASELRRQSNECVLKTSLIILSRAFY